MSRTRPSLDIFPDEHAALFRQLEILDEAEPAYVYRVEYSTQGISAVLEHIVRCQSIQLIRLLMANPYTVTEERQANEKIIPGLEWLRLNCPIEQALQRGLRIRMYDRPASIRGRSFGGRAIALGMYTRDSREGGSFWGHSNFVLTAGAETSQGANLIRWFESVHERMWDDATPIEAIHRREPLLKDAEEWIDIVSSPESSYGR